VRFGVVFSSIPSASVDLRFLELLALGVAFFGDPGFSFDFDMLFFVAKSSR
jgi:hypothetical protein